MIRTLILVALITPSAWALVDMRNANYTNTWIDFEAPGTGFPLQVVRSYNSRSLHNGMFGFGWCSDFETRLTLRPEGTPVVTECGGGQQIVYSPKKFGGENVAQATAQIMSKLRAAKRMDNKALEKMEKDLMQNPELRVQYAQEFNIKPDMKEGSVFYASGIDTETITMAKDLFTRNMTDGSSQRFNRDGRLTHMYDRNGNFIRFEYEKDRLREIIDNNGKRLRFVYYPNGKVQQITAPNNVTMEYKYKGLEDLSFVNNAWGNKLTYEYDDLHNLTKATYPDNTFIAIEYDKKNDWVTGFTDRQKCYEKYTYEFDSKNPDLHYWGSVKKTCEKEVTAESRHEFWYRKLPGGSVALQRVHSLVNGVKTEIVYHEVFNRPVSITRGNVTNTFTYFPTGQIHVKESPVGRLTYKYDPKTRKVEEVTAVSLDEKKKPVRTRVTTFKWDAKGNLKEAWNTDGQHVKMDNDERGRMVRMEDQSKKVITLKYDENTSLPSLITRPGFGSVKITYKPNGEMDKVESPQGANTSLQIVMTFRNYLDITAPATAELYN